MTEEQCMVINTAYRELVVNISMWEIVAHCLPLYGTRFMSTVQSASSFTVIAAHLLFADDTIFFVDGNNETEIEY